MNFRIAGNCLLLFIRSLPVNHISQMMKPPMLPPSILPRMIIGIGACFAALSHGATMVGSATFNSVLDAGTTINVTTMPNLNQWGYLDAGGLTTFDVGVTYAFSALPGANYDATPGSGTVTVTNGAVSTSAGTPLISNTWTFSGGNGPASGTDSSTGRQFGGFAPTENGGVLFNFNDVGLGTHAITLYVGHILSSGNDTRVFRMNHALTATDGNLSGSVASNDLGNVGTAPTIFSTYQITFSNTVDAGADLVLTWDSISGGNGQGLISGYT